jgi:hypothetical protein
MNETISDAKVFRTMADGGSVRIFSCEFACNFNAGSGDGRYGVDIVEEPSPGFDPAARFGGTLWRFVDSFEVADDGTVNLSASDCDLEPIYTFAPGRWFVHHQRDERRVCIVRMP